MSKAQAPSDRPSRSISPRTEIILLALATLLVVGQIYVVIPLFSPIGAEFGHSASAMVIISSAFGIPYAFAGLIAGPLADIFGSKRVIQASLLATSITTLGVAFAPNLAVLTGLRVLQGATAGFLSAPTFAYIARNIEASLRTFATTSVIALGMSSTLLMELFGQFMEKLFGWRSIFFTLAFMVLLLAIAANRILAKPASTTDISIVKSILVLPKLLRRIRLLALYAAALTLLGGFVAVLSGIELYGPSILQENPNDMFLLRASALPVMMVLPFIALRITGISFPVRILFGLGLSGVSIGATAMVAQNIVLLGVGLAFCVAGMLIAAPGIVQSVAHANPENSGAAVSLYTFSIFMGASLGPRIAVTLSSTGMHGLMLTVAVLFVVGAIFGGWGGLGANQHNRA